MCVVLSDELAPDFVQQLRKTFGVPSIESLVGKECYALRCWGFYNDSIEGLESVDTGKRFVLTAWRIKHFPDAKSPAINRRRYLLSEIAQHKRRWQELEVELDTLLDGYVDWSQDD